MLLAIEDAAPALVRVLAPGGQYLACENLTLPLGLNRFRHDRQRAGEKTFAVVRKHFSQVEVKTNFGLVAP